MALWDLKGRVLGRSVMDLLGGRVHDRLPALCTMHATKADIPAMVDEFAGYLAQGFQGIKVGFGKKGDANMGFDHARDVAFVQAMRAGIGDKRLMIDLGVKNFWDVPTAIQRARAFEPYGIHWLEEPLGHDDPEGYRALRAGTSLRIGYGEKEWNHKGVERIVATGTVDVIGLDPGRIEGITGFAKAAEVCAMHRRQANAHNFSTAIVAAASLNCSFALPACRELEFQPVYGPAQQDIVDRPAGQKDGWVIPPEGPGLGVTVNEDLVRAMRLDR
jgi:L-alanine-DL-glutamate epimerase-like enolase superfamily enzyme